MADERAEYDAIQAENWSKLKLLEKSPAHYKQGWGEESDSLKLGTAVHMAILEPEKFAATHVVTDIRRDARTKKWQEYEYEQLALGKTILIQSEHARIIAIRESVLSNSKAAQYLSGGQPEVALQWTLGSGEISFKCKGRADYIGDAIVDLKSTQCSSPRAFARSAYKYGYFGQAAWYSDGLFLSTGKRKPFVIVAVESAAPHLVTVFRVPDALIAFGREQYLSLLGKLDYCQRNNWWGGYTEQDEVDLTLPDYMEKQADE